MPHTLLGVILIIGGLATRKGSHLSAWQTTVLKFDPVTRDVTPWEHGALTVGRYSHVAGRLGDKIVVAGGLTPFGNSFARDCEIFDPRDGAFRRPAASMRQLRVKPVGAVSGESLPT